ncbi:MAG TPA: alpha/beta hydrolase [Phototrophicaceae bacterium]|nr:alpha/beta hydrolase [Phototrophicaceae bacterium]
MPYSRVNDVQLYYELNGNEDGEVILFLHGLGSSSQDWELQVPYFDLKYRILLIDMRGHGHSDKPRGPYSMPGFARDVVALLDQLRLDRVHVVGLSMGGMIAFQLAVDYSNRLRTMTIVNSGPAVVVKTFKDHLNVWMRFGIVRVMGMRKMGETLAPRLFVDADQESLRQMFIERWATNDPRAYMNAMRAIVGWSVEDKISTITIPTLIIAADRDYTPVAAKEAYLAKMSGASLKIIENAHHAVSMERPEQFNDMVYAFITS